MQTHETSAADEPKSDSKINISFRVWKHWHSSIDFQQKEISFLIISTQKLNKRETAVLLLKLNIIEKPFI